MKPSLHYKHKIISSVISIYSFIKLIFLKLVKNIGLIFIGLILCTLLAILFIPPFSFSAGNIFFGKTPALYNVKLANFFYMWATNPIIGKVPPYAYHQLSRTNFIRGNLNQAVIDAKKEIETYPENTRTYYILGLTYGYLKNHEQDAIDAFSKFIDSHPETWAGRNDKAWLQFRVGDIDEALETIEPIVKNNIGNPWVQNTYGTLLMNKKRYAEAKIAFDYALKNVNAMTERDWGRSYPGNDPRVYGTGLNAMMISIQNNLKLLEEKTENIP